MKLVLFALITSFFITAASPSVVLAAGNNCLLVNGGGITDKTVCPTPAPTAAPFPAFNNSAPRKTPGGQTIYPTSKSKSTPSTGPESTSLIILGAMAAIGLYLRRKTNVNY
ncbi:MAG: hypothetical protein ACR2LN_05010 [Candidatus Levyibacteriota bacterium]